MVEKEWSAKAILLTDIKSRELEAPRIEFDDKHQKLKLIDNQGGVKESFDYDEIFDLSLRLETK